MPQTRDIPFDQLIEPQSPVRFAMDEAKLAELVESVRKQGILQNLGVTVAAAPGAGAGDSVTGDGTQRAGNPAPMYEIVFGHRRYKAAQIVGLKEVPCRVFESREIACEAAMLDENLCREDITPAEEAIKYAEMIERYDCTEDALVEKAHRPLSYIYARLDLLKGNKAVFDAIGQRQINLSVAQQLNRIDDEQHCRYLLNMVIEGGASARTVSKWVTEYKANGPGQVVDLAAVSAQRTAEAYPTGGPECCLCRSNKYPANIKWVAIHDFELDALQQKIAEAASPADLSAAQEVVP
jgi:ParB/RepB/Spo0J family partition protein